MNKTYYVLGFCFDKTGDSVVLIRKNKPDWQKGFLNGVGGKVESDENSFDAIVREFQEETGVQTLKEDWRYLCAMTGKDFEVCCFTMKNDAAYQNARTVEKEQIVKVPVILLHGEKLLDNVSWLIHLALDEKKPFVTAYY